MTIKILEPPLRKGDSAIVSIDGNLRVIDPRPQCKGYANCCCCKECGERELQQIEDTQPAMCECECPTIFAGSARCFDCGKPARIQQRQRQLEVA